MQCPKCQFENPEDSLFCGGCGEAIEVSCPNCGSTSPPNFKFCNKCGHDLSKPQIEPEIDLSFAQKIEKIKKYLPEGLTEKILSQKERIEGERKQVTVMFCDMEGFTSLSEMLGIEDAYSIMDQVYEILIHKVQDFEGTVNEMTGDGIMALFGAPIALEDAPQRSIRSSLAIHRELAKFSDRLRRKNSDIPPIRMRIGIHTGPVVVGTVGNDLRLEFKAVGDTVNLASRMEGQAKPGTTYVSGDTFKLTEGLFRFESLGKKEVKGKKEAVEVYRVIAPSSRRTRFDINTERGLTPLAGRERELELLLDCFERVKGGNGQSFSIISEAGLGKSRLLYEFRKVVANEEITFLEGRCFSYSKSIAYYPIIDILKSNFNIQENDDDNDIRKKVQKIFDLYGTDESSIMPFILELLSVKESGIDKLSLNSEIIKNRIFEALKKIVIIGAQIRPLILAIEDLHWIDRTSNDFINYLFDYISGHRVLLIFTFRPEFSHTWRRRPFHNEVNLNRLSNRESLFLATNFLGVNELDRDLEDLILEKTEGVPFFIEEFIKSLDDMGIIKRNGRCCLTKDIQNLVIPSSIQDVIMSRIDSLPSAAKKVLLIGSVIGREFDYNLMKLVAGHPEDELLIHLSHLRNSDLIYERGIYPTVTYILKHALIEDVAFQSLLKSKRQVYHKKIARVMEQHFPEAVEAHPEVMGYHFAEAGLKEQAILYWQKAGEIAIRHSANLEATGHFNMAIEMLRTLPDSPKRTQQELNMLFALGPALMATKGYAAKEVEITFSRASELCQQLGETSQHFNVLRGLWGYYVVLGDLQTALDKAKWCLANARQKGNPALLIWAYFMIGMTSFHLGELGQARDYFEQGIALYDPKKRRTQRTLQDPGVACQSYRAVTLWLLGYPDQAQNASHEALDLAQKLDHPFSLMYALYMAAVISQLLKKIQETREQAEGANSLCSEYVGQPFWLAWGPMLRGWALAESGRIEEGMAEVRQGLEAFSSTGSMLALPYFFHLQADTYCKGEQIEEGITVLTKTIDILDKSNERWWEAELHRLKGEIFLAISSNNEFQAEACFVTALKIARCQRAKSLELRAATSLGRLWQKKGKKDKSRRMVTEIYNWFTEGFDTPDLIEAKRLLDELV